MLGICTTRLRRAACASVAVLGLILFAGCTEAPERRQTPEIVQEWQQSPTPKIDSSKPVTLRVVQAINPRLPRMSPEQIRILLETAASTAKEHFGVEVRFVDAGEITIGDLFRKIPETVRLAREKSIFDWKGGGGDRAQLVAGIHSTLKAMGGEFQSQVAYAAPHLSGPRPENTSALAEALAATMLERLKQWQSLTATDGGPVIDGAPYNEWVFWDSLGYGGMPYDVVVTNQLMASAENYGVDIHTAIRGGVTVGTTTWADNERHALVVWSTFPFLDNSEAMLKLRGGGETERYSAREAAELSGAYLTHEIGHQLFRYGHPFGQRACVMNPVELLRFRAWRMGLDAAACRSANRPEMRAGTVTLGYNALWAATMRRQGQ